MTIQELNIIQENRLEGESLNTTKNRLIREGVLSDPTSFPVPTDYQPSQDSDDNDEGFFADDLMIPRWKIVQPTSRIEDVKEGVFYNTITNETKEKLENIVFLSRHNGRVLFPDEDFSGMRECWSYNGLTPARESVVNQTGQEPKSLCCISKTNGHKKAVCPFAEWKVAQKRPKCHETITFLAVDESFSPFTIIFHGTGIPPVRNFISSVYLKRKQALIHRRHIHLRDFRFTLSLKLQVGDKGKFYVAAFEKVEEIKDEPRRAVLNQCFGALEKRTETIIETPVSSEAQA